MATLSQIRKILDEYLANNWSNTLILWDNFKREIPKSSAWIRPNVIIDISQNTTIGTGRTRHFGAYQISIFTPLFKGSGAAFETATALIDLFQNKTLDPNVLILAGSMRRVGDDGKGWYQVNVILPFQADQLGTE